MPAIGGLGRSESSGISEMTALFANTDAVKPQGKNAFTLTALNPPGHSSECRMSHYGTNGVGQPRGRNQSRAPRGQ